jgi:hypothetical protein
MDIFISLDFCLLLLLLLLLLSSSSLLLLFIYLFLGGEYEINRELWFDRRPHNTRSLVRPNHTWHDIFKIDFQRIANKRVHLSELS